MGPDGPKWGQEDFFPTNPDLADILGDTDFDFENFYFLDFLGSQLGPGLGPAWVWARAWARLGTLAATSSSSITLLLKQADRGYDVSPRLSSFLEA